MLISHLLRKGQGGDGQDARGAAEAAAGGAASGYILSLKSYLSHV